ncbi:oxygenase [Lithospermum erythrorhizon]|uniref:Oxygenase n=1 Tax=Lithospermum erythrorhizon TaxID=34254 RepID=A0AAV3R5Z4_LITER
MNGLQSWPEPIVRVQSLAERGGKFIPPRYVKPLCDRPSKLNFEGSDGDNNNIPIIDMQNLNSKNPTLREETLALISRACREWGFFQVINHGVSTEIMARTREAWRAFFRLPVEMKQQYSNSPTTYEGYGSRLGVEKGAKLDWSDYFFLHLLPTSLRDQNKWPHFATSCRETIGQYGDEVTKLCEILMKIFSVNLGLKEDALEEAFGGEEVGACLRVNYYPKCPQPDLALGLSPHSDPGGMTILLPDHDVPGLQVRRGDGWITVKPAPNAFIVNIGDQIQVISNANYKSVEHRVIVNSEKERVSLAFFYNPKGDIVIKPSDELVGEDRPPLYPNMTFNEYRVYIRTRGPCGKSQVESLKLPICPS